eukprot:m.16192 g.16192  ORF g.16192 m.16192 type:complete len:413 (-) comp5175_c0_seq2:79-1317(-)
MVAFVAIVFPLLAALSLAAAAALPSQPPVIIVPGTTGSLLELKLSDPISPFPWCHKNTTWQVAYPLPQNAFANPTELACIENDLVPRFNSASKTWANRPEVESRTVDFGGFGGMPLAQVIALFELQGWVPKKTIFGAPWDWRFTGNGLESYYNDLKALVEQVHNSTGQGVALAGVSGGCQVGLAFLHRQSTAWKNQYVRGFAAMSPVWSGDMTSVALALTGSGIPGGPPTPPILAELTRPLFALPQNMWLFPRSGDNAYTWGKDDKIVFTPSKSYGVDDMAELLKATGLPKLVEQVEVASSESDLKDFAAPLVNLFVSYGSGVPTITNMTFDKDFSHKYPGEAKFGMTSGDSIVEVRSSLRSKLWTDAQKAANKEFVQLGFPNQQHANCFTPGGDGCWEAVTKFLSTAGLGN